MVTQTAAPLPATQQIRQALGPAFYVDGCFRSEGPILSPRRNQLPRSPDVRHFLLAECQGRELLVLKAPCRSEQWSFSFQQIPEPDAVMSQPARAREQVRNELSPLLQNVQKEQRESLRRQELFEAQRQQRESVAVRLTEQATESGEN